MYTFRKSLPLLPAKVLLACGVVPVCAGLAFVADERSKSVRIGVLANSSSCVESERL